MGLSSVFNVANSGLKITQANLDLVARNIANADTPGYTRKILNQSELLSGSDGLGVHNAGVKRAVDEFLQTRLRVETSAFANIDTKHKFLQRVDELFGVPGEANALDTLVSDFSNSLQELATSPDSFTLRESAVASATVLAQHLRQMSHEVQELRQLAENELAAAVDDVNAALRGLADINNRIATAGGQTADLLDERDRLIEAVSRNLEIRVTERSDGGVAIATAAGNTLLDGTPTELVFDQHGNVNANSAYHPDPAQSGVGTIELRGSNGYKVDLIQNGDLSTGKIGALIDLRDSILPQTQAQLDELAHGLALSFANRDVAGEPVAAGAQEGFDVDVAGLQPGNTVTLNFTQTPPGVERTVTIVRVDDPSQLPLPGSATPTPNDTVIGVDFSNGLAAAAADIEAQLGGQIGVAAVGDNLQFLDDGATGLVDIHAVGATVTATGVQGEGLELPLFTDGAGAYTGSFDGGAQKAGFASRITVNAAVRQNNELLVRYDADTPLGDGARPLELLERFGGPFTFSPESGIGRQDSPFAGGIAGFTQRMVSFQTGQAETVGRQKATQDMTLNAIKERYQKETGVDINEELAHLIALQNSFAANARMLQAAGDMMRTVLEI